MAIIDVFNGDADGICALHQLRLANPLVSTLITGVKRDIALLQQVDAQAGDEITVLDISLDKNREALIQVLAAGASVTYFDHHFAGDIPEHANLEANIDTDANVCTSLLVNTSLNNQFLAWAVTAAFGDNLFDSAEAAARPLDLSNDKLEQLKELGTCINYNGYGATLDDLIYTPVALYELIKPYADPFDFINNESGYQRLRDGYYDDVKQAEQIAAEHLSDSHALFVLPDEKWARRVSGVFANSLAQQFPARAHAMLTRQSDGGFLVSVRAPLENKTGADELCRQFPTGGGRKAAAGINKLPADQMAVFKDAFTQSF
jgi:hypothetical protein